MEIIKKIENRQFRQTRCDSEAFGGRSLRSLRFKGASHSVLFFACVFREFLRGETFFVSEPF